MALDNIVLEPIAKGYNKLPDRLKLELKTSHQIFQPYYQFQITFYKEISNKLVIQQEAFLINTTVGILGIFNPAEKMGIKPYKEDVGQTLATYGIGPGCYFVLPILGPTTARDSIGLIS